MLLVVCRYNISDFIFYAYNCIGSGYVGIIVLSSCSLFLVFQIWVIIVTVNVKTSFLVLKGSNNADIVNICCNGVYSLYVPFT